MKTYLISDLDGTLVDSIHVFVESFKVVARTFNLNESFLDDASKRNLSSTEVIEALEIPKWKLPFVLFEGKRQMYKRKKNLQFFPKYSLLDDFLANYNEKISFHILTSNSKKLVHNLYNETSYLRPQSIVSSSLFSKEKKIKKFIVEKNIHPIQVIYLGDETRDIVAAKMAGVQSWAVTWGLNSEKALKKYNPDRIISNYETLVEHLSDLI